MNKIERIFLFITIWLIPIAFMLAFKTEGEWIGITIALEVGIMASMSEQVTRWFFTPLFYYKINKVATITGGGEHQIWYHLLIKNCGFSSAKNVRVKIRDNDERGWVNLTLPYRDKQKDPINIANLSVSENNYFDIGFIKKNDAFHLALDIYPNNQKNVLSKDDKYNYLLEIVSDNTSPHPFKIQIDNNGYENLDIKII